MEVRAYSAEFVLLGIIEKFSSLLWNRKYDDVGEFELHAPVTQDHISYLARGNVIAYVGAVEAGVIESVKIEQDNANSELVVKGRFLESYLDRRLIYDPVTYAYNFSGYTEVAMRTIITNAASIPMMALGPLNGYEDEITFQATFQNLLTYETKLARSAGYGFRCTPDFYGKHIYFNIYKGLDHTESQSERVRVTFSEEYRNLNKVEYLENEQLLKTVCYVGGKGEGAERTWIIVGDNTLVGLARREVKVNAADIDATDLTAAQYEAKLRQRGEDTLKKKSLSQSFECKTSANGNFKYKEHYDLGDIVTVKKESWGLTLDLRITEITEVYEKGIMTIEPTFGTPLPDKIDWEDK